MGPAEYIKSDGGVLHWCTRIQTAFVFKPRSDIPSSDIQQLFGANLLLLSVLRNQ